MIVFKPDRLEEFWWYVNEREAIYNRRFIEKLPPPWTDDPILRKYSFANNVRARDRGTVWAINNILTLPAPADRVFWTIAYRLFNNPVTMEALGDGEGLHAFDRKKAQKILLKRQAQGLQVWRAAYMLAASTVKGPGAKIKEYCKVLEGVYASRFDLAIDLKMAGSMEEAWRRIMQVKWCGPFIAYQQVLDLDYDPYFKFPNPDEWTYIGPGAVKGIDRLLHNPPLDNQNAYLDAVRELTRHPGNADLKLDVHSCEFSLCEAQKFFRIKDGGKKTRRFVELKPYHALS